jgi:hypothetical protein
MFPISSPILLILLQVTSIFTFAHSSCSFPQVPLHLNLTSVPSACGIQHESWIDYDPTFMFEPGKSTPENCAISCSTISSTAALQSSIDPNTVDQLFYRFAVTVDSEGVMACFCPNPTLDMAYETASKIQTGGKCEQACPGGGDDICPSPTPPFGTSSPTPPSYAVFGLPSFDFSSLASTDLSKVNNCVSCGDLPQGYRKEDPSPPASYPTGVQNWFNRGFNIPTFVRTADSVNKICKPCGEGTFGSDGQCMQCEVGRYKSDPSLPYINSLNTCVSCNHQNYQPSMGQADCLVCEEGYTYEYGNLPGVGRSECESNRQPCPAGSFCTHRYGMQLCNTGRYTDLPAQTSCLQCPSGTSNEGRTDKVSASTCTSCESGKFANERGTSIVGSTVEIVCDPCHQGKYSSVIGATSCTLCPVGMATDGLTGATSLAQCMDCKR